MYLRGLKNQSNIERLICLYGLGVTLVLFGFFYSLDIAAFVTYNVGSLPPMFWSVSSWVIAGISSIGLLTFALMSCSARQKTYELNDGKKTISKHAITYGLMMFLIATLLSVAMAVIYQVYDNHYPSSDQPNASGLTNAEYAVRLSKIGPVKLLGIVLSVIVASHWITMNYIIHDKQFQGDSVSRGWSEYDVAERTAVVAGTIMGACLMGFNYAMGVANLSITYVGSVDMQFYSISSVIFAGCFLILTVFYGFYAKKFWAEEQISLFQTRHMLTGFMVGLVGMTAEAAMLFKYQALYPGSEHPNATGLSDTEMTSRMHFFSISQIVAVFTTVIYSAFWLTQIFASSEELSITTTKEKEASTNKDRTPVEILCLWSNCINLAVYAMWFAISVPQLINVNMESVPVLPWAILATCTCAVNIILVCVFSYENSSGTGRLTESGRYFIFVHVYSDSIANMWETIFGFIASSALFWSFYREYNNHPASEEGILLNDKIGRLYKQVGMWGLPLLLSINCLPKCLTSIVRYKEEARIESKVSNYAQI